MTVTAAALMTGLAGVPAVLRIFAGDELLVDDHDFVIVLWHRAQAHTSIHYSFATGIATDRTSKC